MTDAQATARALGDFTDQELISEVLRRRLIGFETTSLQPDDVTRYSLPLGASTQLTAAAESAVTIAGGDIWLTFDDGGRLLRLVVGD